MCTRMCMCMWKHAPVCACAYVCVCVHVCVLKDVCVCMHAFVRMCVCMHMHVCMPTYVHAYKCTYLRYQSAESIPASAPRHSTCWSVRPPSPPSSSPRSVLCQTPGLASPRCLAEVAHLAAYRCCCCCCCWTYWWPSCAPHPAPGCPQWRAGAPELHRWPDAEVPVLHAVV